MKRVSIKMYLNEGLFLREPQDSKLGRNILQYAISLIDEYGFESFTFKKLAKEIQSTETSIYRYFENKHLLLLYLVNWYWEWVSYLIDVNSMNVGDPRKKLRIIIHSIVSASMENPGVDYINESKLHSIVISEGMKAYHTKEVDEENSKGFFLSYKNLTKTISEVINEVNPSFEYPCAMATNLCEMSNNNLYFSRHLPRLTEISAENKVENEVERMMWYFTEKLLA